MLTPVSWLKDFVEIKLPITDLAWKLSETGLTVEKWEKDPPAGGEDIILDPEITPNRPDWMSIYGIAREIAAVTSAPFKPIGKKGLTLTGLDPMKSPVKIKNDFTLCPRYTAVAVKNITVKSSPTWMQDRLKKVGLRPINNLVDITNYVMRELGNPLHVFDLDKIRGRQMTVSEAKGGESFCSLDGLDYKLPAGAIIIKDVGRVIDLCGIKGGENTAISALTKNILIHVPIYEPVRIRRASQALGLHSDASAIFERGANPGGTIEAIEQASKLVLELAGGKVASSLIDLTQTNFQPWVVKMRHARIEKFLGVQVEPLKVKKILDRLQLETKVIGGKTEETTYEVMIPPFRQDVQIEEDLIEEVGRIIGYNNFPKTLPTGAVPTTKVAYAHNYDFDYNIKQILKGAGYSEIYTYSLISEDQLIKLGIDPGKTLRVDNPISKEYEYLRPDQFGNILNALKLNQANFSNIKLFEFGKEYKGNSCDKAKEEYWLWGIVSGEKFFETKGNLILILNYLGIDFAIRPSLKDDDIEYVHPGRSATIKTQGREYLGFVGEVHPSILAKWGIKGRAVAWELKYEVLKKSANLTKKYQPIPKYPPIIEDISLLLPDKVLVGDVAQEIKTHKLVSKVELLDQHENSKTFRIYYQDPQKNLTDQEVAGIRSKILENLKEKFKVTPKK